jgi:signal transduction histidine kinase
MKIPDSRSCGDEKEPKHRGDHCHLERNDELLSATVGHELRNPVGAIGFSIELMKSETLGAERRMEIIETIQRQLGQISRILDELVDGVANRYRLESKDVDLRQVGLDAIDTVAAVVEKRRQRLSATLPPAGAVCVQGDHGRLIQVVANLLENASKYTPPTGRIVLEIAAGRAGVATITVRDTGIGIRSDFMPRIFDLFAQDGYGHGRVNRGIGIGLALVRSFVQSHGGQIEASSAGEHQGSQFKVELPRIDYARNADT